MARDLSNVAGQKVLGHCKSFEIFFGLTTNLIVVEKVDTILYNFT